MRVVSAACFAAALAAACLGGVTLKEDPPIVSPPRAGDVTGTIGPAEGISSLKAVSRVTGRTYKPAAFDKTTGALVFKDLPGDATYDICLRTTGGRTIEGIDLEFTDARLLRLAERRRKELKLPPERTHKFSMKDAKELEAYVRDMKDFMDFGRVLYIQGHGRRATMLVEQMRTRAHYDSAGRLVWRIELWYFEYQFGGWERVPNTERVLHRERILPGAWRKIGVEYYPELSVHVTPSGYAAPVKFKIPPAPDPSRGRIPETAARIKTKAHILGLDAKPEPTTQPARSPQR